MNIRTALLTFSLLFGGCYLLTVPCEPEEVSSFVQYFRRTCPEPLHALIPVGPVSL